MAKLSWDEFKKTFHNHEVKILILDEKPEDMDGMWIPSEHLESLGLSLVAPKGGGVVITPPDIKKPKPGVLKATGGGVVIVAPKPSKPPKPPKKKKKDS